MVFNGYMKRFCFVALYFVWIGYLCSLLGDFSYSCLVLNLMKILNTYSGLIIGSSWSFTDADLVL